MNPGVTMKKPVLLITIIFYLFTIMFLGQPAHKSTERHKLIEETAKEIIKSVKYCVLISEGSDGYPNARMMDPFQPDNKWIVWMGTNSKSRKVEEIKKNNKVSLYYESPNGDGYVILKGNGIIKNDREAKLKYFKKGWEEFYPENREGFTLIKFIPEKLEIVSYKNSLIGDKVTWEAPSVILKK